MTHALPSAHCETLRLPTAPGLSLAGIRLIIPDHAVGSPALRTLSLCTCRRHYPGAASGRMISARNPAVSAFPERSSGPPAHRPFRGSAFTHVTAWTLALSPIRDTHTESFSYFVTSTAAPVAFGWSVRRVGLSPTGKRCLTTTHTQTGHWPSDLAVGCKTTPRSVW